jgi:hypothetical protein
MESILVEDLRPGMRMDTSLHLGGGELLLYRYQAIDEILMEALRRSSIVRVYSCEGEGEVEELILTSGLRPASIDEYRPDARLHWGLFATNGRKLIPAGTSLRPHRRHALASSGVEIAFEPAGDAAPRLARKRRMLMRRHVPRRGWGEYRSRGTLPPATSLVIDPERLAHPPQAEAASAGLAYAFIASDIEDMMNGLSVGLALDVPTAIDAARETIAAVDRAPFEMVTAALDTLGSGALRDHATASAVVAAAASRALGVAPDECLEFTTAALLHDLAMVWIQDEYVSTAGPLSDAARRAVRRHPVRAFHALAGADGLSSSCALIALCVHERNDGSGYPLGLRGAEVPFASRMLAAVDVLCAVLAPRPHRGRMSGRSAVELCVRLAGEGALDGDAVRGLLRAVGLFPLGSSVWLSTGELARVIATNGDEYERPVVRVLRTASGLHPTEDRIIDLARLTGISIAGAADEQPAPP